MYANKLVGAVGTVDSMKFMAQAKLAKARRRFVLRAQVVLELEDANSGSDQS